MPDASPVPPSYVRSPSVAFLGSLAVDRALALHDLAGSLAHVEMLARVGLLSDEEATALSGGLRQIGTEVEAGRFSWRPELEDVHTNLEVRLTELIGPVGGKLHTARSRNDQIALDERLYLRESVHRLGQQLLALVTALVARAEAETRQPMPGFTHLQRAQPVSVAHWLLAHFWRFDRDLDRLLATVDRAEVSPLGAGALAGSTLPIEPTIVADRLGFSRAFENSMDAVSDRDFFAELLFDLSLLAVHASALGEEVVLFASTEFGYLERSPALGTGSSLMPQKRNPDVAELVRGKTGRVVGDLVALLTTLKGIPLSYDRDLQEDKAPVQDAVSTVEGVLEALSALVSSLTIQRDRMLRAASDTELLATDLAEALVRQGVPFRAAHESVAAVARSKGGLRPETIAPLLGLDPDRSTTWCGPAEALERRSSPGGPAPDRVAQQLAGARSRLEARRHSLSSLGRRVERVQELTRERAK